MTLHVESRGRGPDLVLLHGWAFDSAAWREAAGELERSFTVHAVDLPGHGRSLPAARPGFDDAVAMLEPCIPAGAILCGWSLGGMLAQRIAQRGRARLRALALVASTPCFVQRPDWPHAMRQETLAGFAAGLDEDRTGTLRNFVQLNALAGAHAREAIRAFASRVGAAEAPANGAPHAGLAWLADTDLRAATGRIACPTLVIHGTRDMLVPIEAGRWLARAIPAARLLELADAAHLPFFTHRAAFVAAMESLVG